MTHENQLDELDRLAAEKVMGLRELEARDFIPVPNDGKIYFTKLHAPECCPEPWQPTRNIAQAWEMLEEFKDLEPEITWSDKDHTWVCHFLKKDLIADCCETAPLAIVKACLKAKNLMGNNCD